VFVAFLGQLYAVDIEAQEGTLRQVLSQQLSLPQALSIAVFYVFALQCIATMATLRRESGSWRWVALAFAYTFVLAYVGSWLTYWLARWLL
jgi:ferrous iron transport protein B